MEILKGTMEIHQAQRAATQAQVNPRVNTTRHQTPWKYPGFDPVILANHPNPARFKIWRREWEIWSRVGGAHLELGQGNAWL